MAFNMWLPLTLLVFAGLVSADLQHGWKVGNEYTYLVRSRTLTSLDKISDQYTGILLKALLSVQVKDANTLGAKVWKGQYARIHKQLPSGWNSEISDQMLELRDLPISEKPFEIKIKHGVIRDLIVDRDVPTWEVNILKSIVSQLQVDTQGENAIKSSSIQVPNDDEPYGMFKAMEDSVGGKCEVFYDITPLPEYLLQSKPELVPMPELKGEGHHIDIMKTKNFSRCEQRIDYHFGISGHNNWEPGTNENGKFLSKSATSRIVISGTLKKFTIQSSVTTSQMFVSPRLYDHQNGIVATRMNLTLQNVNRISNTMPAPSNPESTGNLVYIYNNPFSDFEERRFNPNTQNSNQIHSSDSVSSVSSSEEIVKNGQNPRLRSSSSSSASSSSISSSEEHQFWQPKPTLEDAPQNPLLPNFVGYKGKFIAKSGEIDLVRATKELVFQIANELEDPSNIPTQQSLDKFTILCSLIRLMSRRQIEEAESNMHISANELKSNDRSQAVKQNAWTVFRDAVTQAGTGPALLTIKNWILKRNVEGFEAAEIVSRISKNARTPTAQYIRALFDLATNSQVMNEKFLNSTAILAFADLVRQVQVNKATLHNRYPVHTFGRLVSKHDKTVIEEYIPYLQRELKNAIKQKNSPRIQTYIMALGSIGHPRILSVFEPYLEGKEPVTVFQRMMMVASLNKLADMHPKLARSVLYKIYLNTRESHEVRCAAVFLLMKTNPPLSMLQRMAEFTKYDTNKQVNSAVKSTIESLAAITNSPSMDLVNKARAAKNLLSPNDYSYKFSRGFVSDTVEEEQNAIRRTIFNYIGSDDSLIPRALYLGMFASYGDFKMPPTEWATMLSNARPLIDLLQKVFNKNQQSGQSMAEQIAEELNIVPDEPIQLEGNLLWNTKFISRFLPFDRHTIRNIPSLVSSNLAAMKNMKYFNMQKLMSYDIILSFPTETGLPFVYSFRMPILWKVSGNGQLQISNDMSVNLKSEVRALYSKKIQGRIGFVTPFEHQHYIAGVDMDFQTYAPLKLSMDLNRSKKITQIKVLPLKGEEKARLIHYSVVPYTSTHDILNLRPLLTEKNTHKVQNQETLSQSELLPMKRAPTFKLNLEADKSNVYFWKLIKESKKNIWYPPSLDNDMYCQADLYMNLEHEQKEPVALNIAYDSMTIEPGTENLEQWTPIAKAVVLSKEANNEDRRKQLLKEAVKGIKSANSRVVDMQLLVPGDLQTQTRLTLAWASSNVDNKERTLFNWQFNMPQENIKYEVCAASQAQSTLNSLVSYDELMKTKPKVEFDVDVRYGETCSNHEQSNIKGKAIQTNGMKEMIKNSRLAKACNEQMKQGNKILQACQNAAIFGQLLDEVEISMDIQSNSLQELTNQAVQLIANNGYIKSQVNSNKPKNFGKKKVDIKAKLSQNLETADLSLHTSDMDVSFNVNLPKLGITAENIVGVDQQVPNNQNQRSCVLDKTRAETFDGQSYPLRLGNCWHVVMTTYQKMNPENHNEKLRIPENNRVTVLSRETESGQKEVKIILGDQEIRLFPTNSQPEVTINGKNQQITQDVSKQEKQNDETLFEIYRLSDNSIGLVSQKYNVDLVYDGKRVLIKANHLYSNSVRGLCGNFDGDVSNDFVSPRNCIMKTPQNFIATYALTKDQCEGEALENAKKVNKNDCWRQVTNRQSNVISDVDAGRISTEHQNWGYHKNQQQDDKRKMTHRTQVVEVDDKICFSTRPVVSCVPGYTPTETTVKQYSFTCMETNEASLNLKKRVQKGANPDLSQKTVSMTRPISVPLACQA
ncbi:vitellogenin [Calliopsis andreniformis]|uniref:vitellogenin n=1 Tax=Calliopsis andreniformis TaxID=337506 RepID=UPI003FCCACFE